VECFHVTRQHNEGSRNSFTLYLNANWACKARCELVCYVTEIEKVLEIPLGRKDLGHVVLQACTEVWCYLTGKWAQDPETTLQY
jgi:hypothetical protein